MSTRLVWLTPELHQQIIQRAVSDIPREACGVLVGQVERGIAQAKQVLPVENIAVNTHEAYRMDDKRLAQIIGNLEKTRQELVGFYHSHPNGDAIPSPTDVRMAAYPDIPYLIVGLGRERRTLAAWQIDNGEVERIRIVVSETQPEPPEEAISSAQKWAILTSSIAALIFVIVLALMLLPPAPEIP